MEYQIVCVADSWASSSSSYVRKHKLDIFVNSV